jgi:hypothetical protein
MVAGFFWHGIPGDTREWSLALGWAGVLILSIGLCRWILKLCNDVNKFIILTMGVMTTGYGATWLLVATEWTGIPNRMADRVWTLLFVAAGVSVLASVVFYRGPNPNRLDGS